MTERESARPDNKQIKGELELVMKQGNKRSFQVRREADTALTS